MSNSLTFKNNISKTNLKNDSGVDKNKNSNLNSI